MAMTHRFPRFGTTPSYFPDPIEEDAMREDPLWNRGFVDTPDVPPPPPPPMPSMKRGSMVGIEDAPQMEPSRPLPPAPVIDTRELPRQEMMENPVKRYQRELAELKEPERGPVSKWAKIAALGLGAAQGYYNAANPNAKPIDNSDATQALLLGPKYQREMGDYQRKRRELSENLRLAGDTENIESNIEARKANAKIREAAESERVANNQRVDADRNFRFSVDLAQMGGKTVDEGAPLTPGAVRLAHPTMPGKFVDVVPTKGTMKVTDPEIAGYIGAKVGDEVPQALYLKGLDTKQEIAKIRATPEKPQALTTDEKNYARYKDEGGTLNFDAWLTLDSNRKAPRTVVMTDDGGKRLTPGEAASLGVPYGTTRAEAAGKMPATEGQKKEATYATRMARANKVVGDMEGAIANQGTIGQAIQKAVPNFLKTDETQVFEQAKRDFMNAVLRQESGAVISPSEFANADTQYFPQPGDSRAVLEQKRINRQIALDGLAKAAGNAYAGPSGPPTSVKSDTKSGGNRDITNAGTVQMRAPNGDVRPVPADQVEHFKSLGAKVVK